jgi:hypothetical protein
MPSSPKQELEQFIAKYSPAIASQATEALKILRSRLPGVYELVYDNYNALAIGFSPTEKSSDAIFSLALYPKWVSFFFLQGAGLHDPSGILKGTGKVVRHIVLSHPTDLKKPDVEALIAEAMLAARTPMPLKRGPTKLLIKSVSENQRPRRPSSKS